MVALWARKLTRRDGPSPHLNIPPNTHQSLAPIRVSRLISEQSDGLLVLTLNRPEKRNAIDDDLAQALLHARDDVAEDERVRAVLLHGQGTAFCARRDVSADPTEEDLVLVPGVA